jgi:hypothetical protein
VLQEQVSELQEERLRAPQQERAQQLRAPPQALLECEPGALSLQARDALPVADARAPSSEAFAAQPWRPLP